MNNEAPLSRPSDDGIIVTETAAPASGVPGLDESNGADPPTGPLPGTYFKHYEILRPLGAGGMGSVFLARDTKLGRLVAIKLLHDRGEGARRLLAEAQATALARHDNIVIVYEVGSLEGRPYMVLEYVEGRTLRQALLDSSSVDGPALPRGFAIDIITSVVRALMAAHKVGIVHRDLKPENIMLLEAGGVKILDFGLAQEVNTKTRERFAGTLAYMSPEQWNGTGVDERSDIWALGVVFFELVAGVHPLAPLTRDRLNTVADLHTPMPRLCDLQPELPGLSDIIELCLHKRPEERFGSAIALLAALEPFVARSKPLAQASVERPFAGLAAFQEADAGLFWGREREVSTLLGMLGRQALVAVAGISGAGKSSLVRAGLVPALKRSGEAWDVRDLRPGRAPLSAVIETLALETQVQDLQAQPALFGALLRARCRAKGAARRLLLLVDQAEELFTLSSESAERAAFLACLLSAADDASSPVRVVLCIRSDYVDRLAEYRLFMAHVRPGLFFLPPVDKDGLADALTQPVFSAGYRFESDAMLEGMLEELSRAKNPLPLLQFAASKLWEARDPTRKLLTRQAYETMGGVGGALAQHADAVVAALSNAEQRLCRAIFLRLVTPERTRALTYLRDLVSLDGSPDAVDAIVHQLVAARLLCIDSDVGASDAKVELVHESLIERWPTLLRWLDENVGDTHLLYRLRFAASQWEAGGEPDGLLWRDREAEEAAAFFERYRHDAQGPDAASLGAKEERYLRAVISFAERSRRRRNQQIAAAFFVSFAFTIVVFVLALGARKEAARADEEAARVRKQNVELAYQALRGRNATRIMAARKAEDDPTTALAILREIEEPDIPKDWPELVSSVLTQGVARDVWRTSPTRCAYAAVMSPDGTRIAVAMDDQTTRILGDDLVERAVLRGHQKLVWSVGWSPDGKRVVTASFDGTAAVFAADGSGAPLVLPGHRDMVNTAVFSPDGERIVTACDDKLARIFLANDGREIVSLSHDAEVQAASFSPDGKRIVTASADGIARVWNADGQGQPLRLRGHDGMVMSASFNPQGTRIATAGRDRTVRVWEAQTGAELLVLKGHEEKVMSVAWSPDGKRLVSASKDKTARVWFADGRGAPIVLRGHGHWVYTATWSPDGKSILTTSLDGTQRRYFLDDIVAPTLLRGHEDTIRGLVFSPDGNRVATASFDRSARIWNADGSGDVVVLRGHAGVVGFVRFSPDGMFLATLAEDKTGRIWTLDGSAAPVVLHDPDSQFQLLDWSPKSDRLTTTSLDGTIRLWGVDGVLLSKIKKPTSNEYKWILALFDSSGQRVLVMDTTDNTAYLWNLEKRPELVPLGEHESTLRFAKWSRDGASILTITNGGVARVLDPRGGTAPVEIRGPTPIRNGLFDPLGRRVFLALEDGSLRVWSNGVLSEPLLVGAISEGAVGMELSVDGRRLLTSSSDGKVRVRNTDGKGAPFLLTSTAVAQSHASWSPLGDHIAVHYEDKFAWVWPDVLPLSGTQDPRLWTSTSYCVPPTQRVAMLGVSEGEAQETEQACQRRVGEMGKIGAK